MVIIQPEDKTWTTKLELSNEKDGPLVVYLVYF